MQGSFQAKRAFKAAKKNSIISPARVGKRCVAVPKDQYDFHNMNNAFLTGCLALLSGPTHDSAAGPDPVHWKTAKEVMEQGKITFTEWTTSANTTNLRNREDFEDLQIKFNHFMSGLGIVYYADGIFSQDYMPLDHTVNDGMLMSAIGGFVDAESGALGKIQNMWACTTMGTNQFELGNRIWHEAFNRWDCFRSPAFVMLHLELDLLEAHTEYNQLDPMQQRNPLQKNVIRYFYTITMFHAAARKYVRSSQMSLAGPMFQTLYVQNAELCHGRQHVIRSFETFKLRLQNDTFTDLLSRTQEAIQRLEVMANDADDEDDKSSIIGAIGSLKGFRPLKYVYECEDEVMWRDIVDKAEIIAALFVKIPTPTFVPQRDIYDIDGVSI